jgi:hypothetical protein
MSTSISTPASLATFQQPHASSSKLPHVTLSPVEGGQGNQAVAAVQGDGVWTYDVRFIPGPEMAQANGIATDNETYDFIHCSA